MLIMHSRIINGLLVSDQPAISDTLVISHTAPCYSTDPQGSVYSEMKPGSSRLTVKDFSLVNNKYYK